MDINLSVEGISEAKEAGILLKGEGIKIDSAFSSVLQRSRQTLDHVLTILGQDPPRQEVIVHLISPFRTKSQKAFRNHLTS